MKHELTIFPGVTKCDSIELFERDFPFDGILGVECDKFANKGLDKA